MMVDEMTPAQEAAAMHGLATNPTVPVADRLACALRALDFYTAERERQGPGGGLTFAGVSSTNRARCERWHPNFPFDGWTGSDWSNAMQGEAGELAEALQALILGNAVAAHTGLVGNVVKKLRRVELDLNQAAGDTRAGLLAQLATEIGDTVMYLDLLAQHYGLDLGQCVVDTFNRVSIREGFPERLCAGTGEPTL